MYFPTCLCLLGNNEATSAAGCHFYQEIAAHEALWDTQSN